MGKGEYVGKRIVVTLDQEVYQKLIIDAEENGLPPATRAKQILTIALKDTKVPKKEKEEL